MADCWLQVGGSSTDERRLRVLAVEVLGWVGSALLVYSVLQTRILRLRLFNGVASALLVIFNAAIAVWPMVALNATLTAINVFYTVRLLRGRHDLRTFEVVQISPDEAYLKHLLHEFDADIQHFNPGFSGEDAARAEFGFLILTAAEAVGLVLARNAGGGAAQVELDYVVPRYQGFTFGEFVYRLGGPFAARGYRRVIAPPRMQNAGHYLTEVGFRPEGDAMVRDLT
jgi:hypothetical protein